MDLSASSSFIPLLSTSVAAGTQVWGGIVVIGGLALIGGLAAACFTKAFGVVFLGEPRSGDAVGVHEAPLSMCWPMATLAALCVVIGLTAPWMVRLVMPAVAQLAPAVRNTTLLSGLPDLMTRISLAALVLAGLTALLAGLRWMMLRRRTVRTAATWDCGYAAPTARMQYTASSYAQPVTGMFQTVLRTRCDLRAPQGLFPVGCRSAQPDTGCVCSKGLRTGNQGNRQAGDRFSPSPAGADTPVYPVYPGDRPAVADLEPVVRTAL